MAGLTNLEMLSKQGQATVDTLQSLERKLDGMSGVASSLTEEVNYLNDTLSDPSSNFFAALGSKLTESLKQVDTDRRYYEDAMAQNRAALEQSNREIGPQRGDAGFWSKAFEVTPATAAETQARALKQAFEEFDFQKTLRESFGGNTIKTALSSNADMRTFGEKALDSLGFGFVNSAKNWIADRNIRKEAKADAKDRGEIKRESRAIERLGAKYRKAKRDNATEDELTEILEAISARQDKMEEAARRIEERSRDPMNDLVEMRMADVMGSRNAGIRKDIGDARASDNLGADAPANDNIVRTQDMADRPERAPGRPGAAPDDKELHDIQRKPDTQVHPDFYREGTEFFKNANDKELHDIQRKLDTQVRPDLYREGMEFFKKANDKELHDIQRKLDTQVRPEFYREGTEFFKKANDGDLFDSITSNVNLKSAGKGGATGALIVAALASINKIAEGVGLVADLVKSGNETQRHIEEMTKKNNDSLDRYKHGWNNESIEADKAENEARAAAAKESASALGIVDRAVGGVVNFVTENVAGEKVYTTELEKREAELDTAVEKSRRLNAERYEVVRAAREAGVDTKDADAMNRFAESYRSGHTKLAAGNLEQTSAPTVSTPGVKAEPERVETAAEQAKRMEDAMYMGSKRALTDADVQRQNEENARLQGRQINESMVGRD